MNESSELELDFTDMVYGGSALSRHDGRPIFTPYALPGERARVRIVQDKGRFAFARLEEVLQPAPERVSPRCKHFGVCGGCHWQHADYPAQLAYKRQIVAEQFRRIAKLPDVTIHPTIPSPDSWAYRTHVTFHVTDDGRLGFVGIDDQTVIPIDECHILRPPLVEMFAARKDDVPEAPGTRLRLQAGSAPDERLSAAIQTGDDEAEAPRAASGTRAVVHYTIRGRRFRVSAGAFFQVNLAQAATLLDLVLARLDAPRRVLDLYAGVGLFTAFLAERAAHVTAVEVFPPALRDARHNLSDRPNVTLVEAPVETALPRLEGPFDAVVLDPPRAGVKPKALDALLRLEPAAVVYVSCDPSTLARDARRLVDGGLRLVDVQPVDMFPQTYHIESVASFVR